MVEEFGLTTIDATRSIEKQQREMRNIVSKHLPPRKKTAASTKAVTAG